MVLDRSRIDSVSERYSELANNYFETDDWSVYICEPAIYYYYLFFVRKLFFIGAIASSTNGKSGINTTKYTTNSSKLSL